MSVYTPRLEIPLVPMVVLERAPGPPATTVAPPGAGARSP